VSASGELDVATEGAGAATTDGALGSAELIACVPESGFFPHADKSVKNPNKTSEALTV
jgi:hypothetical protein